MDLFFCWTVGVNEECFRFWEAIEAGSIPIYVPRTDEKPCPAAFEDVLRTNPPIVILDSWSDLPAYIDSVTEVRSHTIQ